MKIEVNGKVSELLKDVKIPKMFYAKQEFDSAHITREEIEEKVFMELSKNEISSKILPGMRIAITAGSRGIRNVDEITRSIVKFVDQKGAKPFIVPSMGSHGGATAQGQIDMLAGFGITEESMGCPILSSMEVVELGTSDTNRKVFFDKNAYEADGVIVSCRIKPHNAFRGKYESGFCKMMVVGLGKQAGAEIVHSDGMGLIGKNIPSMAEIVLKKAPILFGIACIENAYDETFLVKAVDSAKIMEEEPRLLQVAFKNMPNLIMGKTDVLVVDEIGKNYSGTGVDPNITGTFSTEFASGGIDVQRTCFLNLSEISHGNSLGVGLASVITKKLFDDIDTSQMYPNCITSTVLKSAMIPVVVANDKEAIQMCIRTCNNIDINQVNVVRIPNSLHIGEIMLSESYFEDVNAGKYPGLKAMGTPMELEFDENGNLLTKL